MNPDTPHNSREELEAGLTALLLGELPPEQAAELRRAIEQDPALAALYQRLKLTIDLVRETAVQPAQQTAAQPAPLKLSEGRRQELLAHFKTLTPKEFAQPRRQQWRLPVLAAAAAMLAGLLALALFLPALTHSRSRSLARAPAGGTVVGTWALEPGKEAKLAERLPGDGRPGPAPSQTAKNAKNAKTEELGRPQLAPTPPEAESLKLAERGGAGSPPRQEPPSGTYYGGGAYGGYSSITPMPQGSPEWAKAKASQERVDAILAPVPSAAPAVSLQVENGRKSPPPAAGKRTAIVLPGSAGANETAGQTGAPSSGETAVKTCELRNADPDQLAGQLPQLSPDTSRTESGPGFGFRFGGGGPFGGGMYGEDGKSLAQPQSTSTGGFRGGAVSGPIPESDFVSQSVAVGGGVGPMGGGMGGGVGRTMLGVTPPKARVTGIQDQIPILGDKPVIGLGWENKNTALAAAGKELKAKNLPAEVLLADSKAEGLPAQAPTATATAPQGDKAAEEAPEAAKRSRRFIPGPPQEPAQNRDSSGVSNVYFSIDPESRGVFTAEQGLAGNGFAARYAYVVPSVTNAVRRLEELERKGTTLEPKLREGLAGLVVGQQRLAQAQEDANQSDRAARKQPAAPAPIPQPEVQTRENAFSTFSLNVSDVSFKLAAASLEKGQMPEPAAVRSEEFINAFDYRDPEAPAGVPVAFACERARYPFAHNRDLLRFSLKTAAGGRQAGRALNIVLLLDSSGSMERADRVRIIHEALRVLAGQLDAQDTLSVVTFARTARLWVDGVPGSQAGQVAEAVSGLTPQGGTNLEVR